MRGYDAAGTGLVDDLIEPGASLTIDFLPGGAPEPDELDRLGTVVATHRRQAPIYVLADEVSLRAAWTAITHERPTRLSDAVGALAPLRRYTETTR